MLCRIKVPFIFSLFLFARIIITMSFSVKCLNFSIFINTCTVFWKNYFFRAFKSLSGQTKRSLSHLNFIRPFILSTITSTKRLSLMRCILVFFYFLVPSRLSINRYTDTMLKEMNVTSNISIHQEV